VTHKKLIVFGDGTFEKNGTYVINVVDLRKLPSKSPFCKGRFGVIFSFLKFQALQARNQVAASFRVPEDR
jgi:hypothetical protein